MKMGLPLQREAFLLVKKTFLVFDCFIFGPSKMKVVSVLTSLSVTVHFLGLTEQMLEYP